MDGWWPRDRHMRGGLILAAALACGPAAARVLTVGPGQAYASPSLAARAARDGDTVLIEPGEYYDCAVWLRHRLTIAGTGPGVVLTDSTCQGKAVIVMAGDGAVIRDLTLARARVPDGNGAGIRLEGQGLTVERVRFVNNQVGLLSGASGGEVRLSGCSFEAGGGPRLFAVWINQAGLLRIEASSFKGVSGGQVSTLAARTELAGLEIEAGPGEPPPALVMAAGGELLVEDTIFTVGQAVPRSGAAVLAQGGSAVTLRRNRLVNQTGQSLALLLDWTGSDPVLDANQVPPTQEVWSTRGLWRHRASEAYHTAKDSVRHLAGRLKRSLFGL